MKSTFTSVKIPFTLFIVMAVFSVFAPRVAAQTGPTLSVSPDTLKFYVDLCWDSAYVDSTMPKTFMVANVGDGDMTWTGVAGESWAAFDPQAGGNFDSVSVWIDWAYVPQIFAAPQPGDTLLFETHITVSSPEADNSPRTVVVQLGYTCEPHGYVLAAWPNYFDLNATVDDTLTASFAVWEAYGRSIEFSCGNFDSWLHIDQPPGPRTTPDTVTFNIITVGMQPGVYVDTIAVSTPEEPSNSPYLIIVRLYIGGGEDITLAAQPDWFGYTLQVGETSGDSLLIYETGGKSINFVTYNRSTWLYVDTMAASPLFTPEFIFVNVSAVGLTPGVYTDTIEIFAGEAVNSPLRVPVSLIVENSQPVSAINASPPYFQLTLPAGQMIADSLRVYETNGQAVECTMETRVPWLGLTAEPPYITPFDAIVGISAESLSPGYYIDTIFITPVSDTTVYPAAVPVYLQVVGDEPVLVSMPDYFPFTLAAGDTLSNTGLWVYEASGDTIPFAVQTMHDSPWLRIYSDPDGYMTPDSVRFGLFTDGLAPGTYGDTIILYNPLDYPEPYYETIVPIILTVQGEPSPYEIATDPPSFAFALPTDSSTYDTLSIHELHGDTISFLYFHAAPWLAVNPYGMPPYTTPMTMPVAVTSWGLIPGTYVDTIFIGHDYDSTGAGMTAVPVTLIVGSANYVVGDANGDFSIDIADAVEVINYIFKGGPAPEPLEAADANCDARVNIGDAVFVITYIFRSGPPPGCF